MTQKIGINGARVVKRKNTEVLVNDYFNSKAGSKITPNTMQKVMDIQENLNVTLHKGDTIKQMQVREGEDESRNSASALDQIHSMHDSVY